MTVARTHLVFFTVAASALLTGVGCGDSTASSPKGDAAGGAPGGAGAGAGQSAAGGAGSAEAGTSAHGGASSAVGGEGSPAGGSDAGQGGSEAAAGGDRGGFGGEGNSGGWNDCLVGVPTEDGGAGSPPLQSAEIGQGCDDWGSLACAGADQQQSLVCKLGQWEALQTCAPEERCDQRSGRCEAVVPACADVEPGSFYCQEDALQECGPDRVSVRSFQCCGVCSDGECHAPRCGDGQTSFSEACDDGNRRSGDGCDADCQPSDVVQIVAGARHTCALLRLGRVRCWGGNDEGQLGLGDDHAHSEQHPYELELVPLAAEATQLVAGSRHTCALLHDGQVRCWGANEHGQLGLGHEETIGDDEPPSAQHATVPLGAEAQRLSAGGESTCAVLVGGGLRCWGRNDWGQLGLDHDEDIGDDEPPSSATVDLGDSHAVAAAASGEHLCVALSNRTFRCWGYNEYEQLNFMNSWQLLAGGVSDMWGSGFRTYTLLSEPSGLFAAGFNLDGLLGVAGVSPPEAPSDSGYLGTNHPTEQVAVGPAHVCYLQANQTMYCFGLNDDGQLGLPDTTDRYGAVPVSLGWDQATNPVWAQLVGAGEGHTCAWLNSRKLRCWGLNAHGQLGLGYASVAPLDHVGGSLGENAATAVSVKLFTSD